MKIKEILSQSRRDMTCLYECESCGFEKKGSGYDDSYFHQQVIPQMACDECGATASENYRPMTTKYADHVTV